MIPAIVTAGDRKAARAVYGESKVFLEVEGIPLVVRIVDVLQRVPEVSEVFVVGDAARLEAAFEGEVRARLVKPLHIVEQFRNLFENCWQTFRRALPGAGPEGRDPVSEADHDTQVLYLSADLPFATPQELSEFIRRGRETGADYALGLCPDHALEGFRPATPGGPGIEVAYFNMREGRLRQNNLHLARPARMGARHLIEEMYEHRHQKKFGNMLSLGWRLLRREGGGFYVLFFYALIHLGGLLDRWRLRGLADQVRRINAMERTERACGSLLQTSFRFVVVEAGGCAIDVDTEPEYDAVVARFEEWSAAEREQAERLYGPVPELSAGSRNAAGEG